MENHFEEKIILEDLLRQVTIDRSDEETMIDYYLYIGDEEEIDVFIENIKHLLLEDDWSILNKEFKSETDFNEFLSSETGQELLQVVCEAAYCCWQDITINDDTRVCEDKFTYFIHWNGIGVESEYTSDIDLG